MKKSLGIKSKKVLNEKNHCKEKKYVYSFDFFETQMKMSEKIKKNFWEEFQFHMMKFKQNLRKKKVTKQPKNLITKNKTEMRQKEKMKISLFFKNKSEASNLWIHN